LAIKEVAVTRRKLLVGAAASLLCAPAIVRAGSLMAVRGVIVPVQPIYWGFIDRLRFDWLWRSGQMLVPPVGWTPPPYPPRLSETPAAGDTGHSQVLDSTGIGGREGGQGVC
jgi:hypothetical protein